MSDVSQGPGWWRASNGLWYPPEAKPGPRQPPGVPDRPPADPRVQLPFTPRTVEPLELDRDRDRPRRRRRDDDSDHRRAVPWGWLGVLLLVVLFGGAGTYLALTASVGGDDTAATTTDAAPTTAPTTSTSAPTTTTAEDQVSVFELAAGDCFDLGADPEEEQPDSPEGDVVLSAVRVVPCGTAHLAEVIEVSAFRDEPGEPFPGEAARDTDAEALCTQAFEEYVGAPLASSELGLIWLAPTQESWEERDDRGITCAAQSIDGEPLVGSVAGSGR